MHDEEDVPNRSTPLAASLPAERLPSGAELAQQFEDPLPFRRPTQGLVPNPTSTSATLPRGGVVLPRRPPPTELSSPGTLISLGSFLAGLAPFAASASPSARSPSTYPGPPSEVPDPRTTAPGTLVEPSSSDSPWFARPSAGPSGAEAHPADAVDPVANRAGSQAHEAGEGFVTNSPWLQNPSVPPPATLPSANASYHPSTDSPSAAIPHHGGTAPTGATAADHESRGARGSLTLLLSLAAIGLVGAIVYVAIGGKDKSDDPADVAAGRSQREYDLAAATPSASASTSASAAPKPRFVAPTRPSPPPPPPKPKGDIYDDL